MISRKYDDIWELCKIVGQRAYDYGYPVKIQTVFIDGNKYIRIMDYEPIGESTFKNGVSSYTGVSVYFSFNKRMFLTDGFIRYDYKYHTTYGNVVLQFIINDDFEIRFLKLNENEGCISIKGVFIENAKSNDQMTYINSSLYNNRTEIRLYGRHIKYYQPSKYGDSQLDFHNKRFD